MRFGTPTSTLPEPRTRWSGLGNSLSTDACEYHTSIGEGYGDPPNRTAGAQTIVSQAQ